MEHNENAGDALTRSIQEAVAAFSRQVGESSQQLAQAAQRFAAESTRVNEDAVRKVDASVAQSAAAAGAASAAASEARRLADSVQAALSEASERVKQETTTYFQGAVRQTEEAVHASQQTTTDLQERLQQALRQAEDAATAGREYAAQAASAAQEAREAAGAVAGGSAAGSDVSNVAEAAAQTARSAAMEVLSLREAVASAARDAKEAREAAMEATALAQTPVESPVSIGAQEVLERLEGDYSLLTKLVQELHARIASLSANTAPVYQFTPPANQEPIHSIPEAEAPSYSEPVYAEEEEPVYDSTPSYEEPRPEAPFWQEPAVPANSWDEARFTAAAQPQVEEEISQPAASYEAAPAAPEAVSPTIAGRVLVSISPVPDFDRLLSLDGALGRMTGIGNVTLADYAREEVTFRVEVDPPTSVEDFRNRLSQSAGASIEVVANGDDGLALRLAS